MKLTAIADVKYCNLAERKRSGDWTKTLRVMKLTAIILLAACMQVSAKGFGQKVSISVKDAPLETVIEKISKQTGYSFFYNVEWMEKANKVTAELHNVDIDPALKTVFKEQPVSYKIINNTVVLTLKENKISETENVSSSFLSFIPITGVITDSTGKPLQGANIEVKGTKKRTTTDSEGRFVIDAKEGDVLVVSYVGYGKQEVTVGKETVIRVSLNVSITEIEGVTINTGYQKISPQNFVGSYSQLDSPNFHRRAGMGIIERLDGTVTSIQFNRKGTQFPMIVRGFSSLGIQNTNTNPLIVIDNFPIEERADFNLNNINPNDVESVTILKDAAAASVWGTRAANGVIVITTKRGRFNQPFRLSFTSNVTIEEKPDLFYIPRISPSEFIDVEQFLFSKNMYSATLGTPWSPVSPVVEILDRQQKGLITQEDATNQIDALRKYDLRNDLNNYVYREAVRQQYHINLSGGTHNMAYNFSVGYNRNLNNIQGSKPDQQITIGNRTTFKPLKRLQFETGINLAYSIGKGAGTYIPPSISPYARLADDDGNAVPVVANYSLGYIDTAGAGKNVLLDWNLRPLDEVRLADNNITSRFVTLNFGVGYDIANWLKASVQYQFMNGLATTRNHKSIQTYEVRNLINYYANPNVSTSQRYPVPMGGFLDFSNSQSQSHNVRGTLSFNKRWNSEHTVTALAGGELSEGRGYSTNDRFWGYNEDNGTYNTVIDYITKFPLNYGAFQGTVQPITPVYAYIEQPVNRIVSLLANANYSYKNRYNLYASARRDGANIFGVNTNNKWKPLWSVGGSWDISKENFYKINWMSSLRLRASYGYTGNVNNFLSGKLTMNYALQPNFFSRYIYGGPSTPPNPDLKWEETKIINTGLDFQVLEDRLSGSIEFFRKNSTDVISNLIFPPSSGTDIFYVNAASLKTNGFDINLNSRNTKGIVTWTTGLGFSHAKTIVTKFYKSKTYARAADYIAYAINPTEGEIAFGISSYRWAGLDPATGDPQGYFNGQVTKNYTSIFNDTIKNQVFHGSAIPLYTGFMRNDFSWKGLTFSINITGRFNYYYRKPALNINYSRDYNSNNYITDYYNRWQNPGDEAHTNIPSMIFPTPAGVLSNRNTFYEFAEINVKRGDNIRVQDIRLGYLLKGSKLPFQSAQVFVYPNNLNWVIWRLEDDHYDPDVYGNGYPVAPPSKTWTAGVIVNF